MNPERKFKKGEAILTEGEISSSLYVIQSGTVSLFIERGGQSVQIEKMGPGQTLGEQAVFGFGKSSVSAVADSEVKCLEVPVAPIKTIFEKSPGPYKVFVKSLGENIRKSRLSLKDIKMEQDNAPCPGRFIPRICAILTLVAKNSGAPFQFPSGTPPHKMEEEKKNWPPRFKDTDLILNFSTLKIFTSRMFLESHVRMESFCQLLEKLGYLHCHYEKNEDTEQMELRELRIHDLETIEHFGEFYQHNFFKAGKSEVIHIDPLAVKITGALVALANPIEADRGGVVKLEYAKLLSDIKSTFYIELKDIHLGLLEKKGLYVKRQSVDDIVYFSFDKFEFQQTYKFWQIIQEIDYWNEKGHVDTQANYNEYKPEGPAKCPGCEAELKEMSKFCPECGAKLAA